MKRQLKKQDFLSLFRKEAEGHILELNKGLVELESDPKNRAALEEVRRRAHTLKGSARMMGFTEISNAAHTMEDLLESVRMEVSELDESVFDLLFQGLDSIGALLKGAGEPESQKAREPEGRRAGRPESREVSSAVVRPPALQEEAKEVPSGVEHSRPMGNIPHTPGRQDTKPAAQDAILVKTDKLDSLAGVVSEMVLDQIKSENQMTEISQISDSMREQVKLWSQIKAKISEEMQRAKGEDAGRDSFRFSAPGSRLYALSSKSHTSPARGLQIEEINRYNDFSARILDDMMNLLDEYKEITTRRTLIIGELQDDIRTMRLIPISSVFDTFPRAVRDLSREYNKEIDLEISGGEVELDKSIIETIKDPLMHLVRNAVDHGIEEPEERLRLGKPESGNISLSAYHRGSKVVMEISDDGAGIDLEKIKAQAVRKGYIEQSHVETMDEESATQLVFLPGLSTSSIITDMSGRGVGMDVVRENISRKLKGTVNIHSGAGKGTKISLAVPITLAIMRGLLVRVGQEVFAIPTESVEKNVSLPRDQIRSVEGKQVMVDGDRIIPLVELGGVLGIDGTSRDNNDDKILVAIIDHSQKQIGFCVDGFAGEQEMVIKSLGSYSSRFRVPNVAGITVLGNGDVVSILHVSDLMDSARNKLAAAPIPAYAGTQERLTEQKVTRTPSILIVDDSLTTRELERNILEASGYDVHVAVDGLDGLNKVSEGRFDLIISDVQMPRMDGFHMVERLKQNEQYKDIPVIMVTALQKDEEKRRGIEVGASAYIVKSSFDQAALLDTIERLIG
jgi:two-component system chemotaxis sensor kinase CheA